MKVNRIGPHRVSRCPASASTPGAEGSGQPREGVCAVRAAAGQPLFPGSALREGVAPKPRVFVFAHLADILSKTNELRLALRGKQLIVFAVNDQI